MDIKTEKKKGGREEEIKGREKVHFFPLAFAGQRKSVLENEKITSNI